MAVTIIHGPNGSYKSASIVWFEILPALRAGRPVVTNVEGMYPLEYIESALNEKFPDTARLWRIASNTPQKQKLWRYWFCWMPVGVKVVIDEAQDIYPKMKGSDGKLVFRPEEIKLHPIDDFAQFLPSDLVEYFHVAHQDFKPTIDESSFDDTGEILFDKNGRIIYPHGFTESYMRHRKYNWDVVLGTPDIKKIHADARGCAEVAFAHASKDSFLGGKRKPRIFEHDPKTNGIPSAKDITYRRFVPVAVHRCYKSTQTNTFTKSGASGGVFTSFKLKLVVFGILPACFLTLGWMGFRFYNEHYKDDPISVSSQSPQVPQTNSVSSPVRSSGPAVSVQSTSVVAAPFTTQAPSDSGVAHAVAASAPLSPPRVNGFIMPYDSTRIYWAFKQCDYTVKPSVCDFAFIMDSPDGRSLVYSQTLLSLGYRVSYQKDSSVVTLIDDSNHRYKVTNEPLNFESDYYQKAQQMKQTNNIQLGLLADNKTTQNNPVMNKQ